MVVYQLIAAFSKIKKYIIFKNHLCIIAKFTSRFYHMQVFIDCVRSIVMSITTWIAINYEKEDVI